MRWIIIILCIAVGFGCQKSEYEPPLSEDQTIEMLIDMHLAEGGLARIKKEDLDSVRQIYRQSILLKYNLTEQEQDQYINHLKNDPVYLGEIYDRVFDSLDVRAEDWDQN